MTRRLTSSGTRSSKQRLPGLHVEDRDAHALGDVGREGAVGVAEDEQAVGLAPRTAARPPARIPPTRCGEALARDAQIAIRGAHAELVEEDVAERRVEVLPGVDEDVSSQCAVEALDHAAQPDDLGPRPEDGRRPSSRGLRMPRDHPVAAEQLVDRGRRRRRRRRSCTRGPGTARRSGWPGPELGQHRLDRQVVARASTVRGASSSETRISCTFSPGPDADVLDLDLPLADQRARHVHDPRRRHAAGS